MSNHKNIILIGFKHTGKSTIGYKLSQQLQKPFIDLDKEVESACHNMSCTQIVEEKGEDFFRQMEFTVLTTLMHTQSTVIALGGGTPLKKENQSFLQQHFLIHLTVDPKILYERIVKNKWPAIFPFHPNDYDAFYNFWHKREQSYAKLSHRTINNDTSIHQTIEKIVKFWSQHD